MLISSCSVPTISLLFRHLSMPLWHFLDRCNPILAFTTGESMRIVRVQLRRFRLYIENAVTRNKPCTRNQVASEWVKKILIWSWLELHFTTISYILRFNFSFRYEINLVRIMYATNSSILYSKDKTVRILGTWDQYLVNVSCLCYSKQIEFQEELINFLRTWLLEVSSC